MGAEAVSLAAEYSHADKFRASGYANITTNATYTGGVVRQYGRFSFSRVFDAGHGGMYTYNCSFTQDTVGPYLV
jgi:hypothetical protein